MSPQGKLLLRCDMCGIEIWRYPSQVDPHNFCSRACCNAFRKKNGVNTGDQNPLWKGGPITRICKTCGKEFTVKPSQVAKGRGIYCSRDCQFANHHVIKHCEACGKEIRVKNYTANMGQGRYCSIACRSIDYIRTGVLAGENAPRYIDGKSHTPEGEVRRSALRRARKRSASGTYTVAEWEELCAKYGNHCLACGRDDVPLTVDHVIPLSQGGANDISNLQPLCLSCNCSKNTRTIDYR